MRPFVSSTLMPGPRVVATIEARMTSTRLPGKVLLPAAGRPLLEILIGRLHRARSIHELVVATTIGATDQPIVDLAGHLGVRVFRGSEHDVLARVCGALRATEADVCVELTGDCPLIDPEIVDEVVHAYVETAADHPYASNSDPQRSVPIGLDVQVFAADSLFELDRTTSDARDREHVSYGFYRPESDGRWRPRFVTHESTRGAEDIVVALDYREDYDLIRALHEELVRVDPAYGAREIVAWVRAHPELHDRCLRVRGRG